MADPLAPASPDPFASFDVTATKPSYAVSPESPPTPPPSNDNADPFANFSLKATSISYKPDESSATGAFARGAEKSAIPAIGSFPAIGVGAEVGLAVGGPVGALVGGVAGGLGAGYLLNKAQDWAVSKLPDGWKESIGMDDRQQQIDQEQHPTASFLGGLVPYAVTMRPGSILTKGPQLAENATGMQKIMANPVTARVFGGALMGGMELGQEEIQGDSPDWTKVGISTAFGLVFNHPTRIGETLTEVGARPTRTALGRPQPAVAGQPAPEGEPAAQPAEPEQPQQRPSNVSERDWNETILGQKGPTVAQAGDLNVAGPGTTEATFMGGEDRTPNAALTNHDAARVEESALVGPKRPDVNEVARTHEPELFNEYDQLVQRRDEFRRWINEFNSPPEEHFQELDAQRAALQSQLDQHIAERQGYEGGSDARRLRAQIRDVDRETTLLRDRAEAFKSGTAEETADIAMARQHLIDTEFKLRDMAPGIRAAYGRAADAIGAGTVEPRAIAPEPVDAAPEPAAGSPAPPLIPEPSAPTGPVVKPLADQKTFIAQDVARQMVAAGRPAEEADAAAKLIASRYVTRAARFEGKLGTPEEMYLREGAQIRGQGRQAPEPPATPRTPQELAKFIKDGGQVQAAPAEQVKLAEEFKPGPGPKAPAEDVETTEVKAKTPRGAAARDPETWSLLEFLASRGGISPDERNISDLRSIFGKKSQFVPGFGQLVRPGGMSIDRALEAAVEAGYIHDEGRNSGGQTQVRPEDLKTLIEAEVRGQKQYRSGQTEPGLEMAQDDGERQHQISGALDAALKDADIPVDAVAGKLRDRVIQIMDKEGVTDPIAAWERAVMEQDEHGARAGEFEPRTEAIEGWDVPDDAGPARGAGEAIAPQENQDRENAGGPARPVGEGAAEAGGLDFDQGARGKINILEGRKPIITLMKDANASTFIHETGHQFLEELARDSQHPLAPNGLRDDADTVLKWLGAHSLEDIKTRHHEKFARGFEQYLREGTAPSQELAGVFHQFKEWLVRIYETVKGLGKPISDDIRGVFDRMLVENPERTVIAPDRPMGPTLAEIHEADAQHTSPAEAEVARDRVVAEAQRAAADLPPQVQNEIQAALAEVRTAAQPAAEGGERPGGAAEVVAGGGQSEPQPAGEPGGEEHGAQLRSGAEAGGESPRVSGPEQRSDAGPGPQSNPLAPTPARTIEPGEPKLVDKAGNVRIENLTSIEDVANAIRESAERNADFQSVRGQTTMGEMQNLADAVLIDPHKVDESQLARLFGGFQDMAPKIWALRKALVDSAQMVSDTMKRVRDDPSDANAVAFAMSMTRHDMMQSTLSRVTAESGRTLGMSFKNLQGWEAAKDIDQFMKENTGRTLFQLKMMAKMGASLDSPAKVSKFLRDSQNRNFPGMILEYWINGLISGVATHTTYTIGNGLLAAVRAIPDTAVAAALGRMREAGGEAGAHVQLGEVGARLGAVGRGLPAAVEAAIEAGRSGVTTLLPGEVARPSMPFAGDSQLTVGKNATNEPVKWGDVQLQVAGIMRGLRDGIVAQAALLKAGGDPSAPTIGPIYSPLGQIPDIGFKGVNVLPLGTMARLPSRGVAVIHSFFRSVNYSMEKAADAYRTASVEGLQGQAFDQRAAQIWTDPSEAQMDKYRAVATDQTLMGQGGEFTKRLGALMNVEVGGWKPLKFIDPFVHISSNIIKQTLLDRTPIGLISPQLRADLAGRVDPVTGKIDVAARDMAQARMLVGTALSMTFAGLASQNYISGSGPSDRNEAAMWRLAGNQAHSVRIGDTWWDMHRLGPLGMLLGISADLYTVAHTAQEGEYLDAAQHLQHAITQNILDESFMKGPASLIQAIEDPDRYGQAYIKGIAASFVPYSVGLAQQARATDPYTRQARTVVDTIRAKIPGHLNSMFPDELFPKRDIWGQPMPNPDALVAAGLTAIYAQQMSHDPVNLAMLDLGIGPAPVQRKIRNVDLTDAQYDDFSRIAGRTTKVRLDAIVASPDWANWPSNIKATVVQEVIKQSREAARGLMLMKYPQIVRDATQAKIDGFREQPEAIK